MSSEALNFRFMYIPWTAFWVSLVIHLSLPFGMGVVKILDHFGIHSFPPRVIIDPYQEFVQVDVVGLPDVQIKDLEKLDATMPVVPKPETSVDTAKPGADTASMIAEQEAKDLKEREQKKRVEEEKQKNQALKKLEQEAKREAALKDLLKKPGKEGRQELKGNIKAKGTATVGAIGEMKELYTSLVKQKIKENFFIMPSQRGLGLIAIVRMEIYPNGRLKSRKVVKPSTDPLYDSAVLQAVDESQPFPTPEDISIVSSPFTITFREEDKR